MKQGLLSATALVGAGLAGGLGVLGNASPAVAESPIQLSVGGFFRTAYMVVLDDDRSDPENNNQEPGDDRGEDGVFSDAEIHLTGRTVLDNGLEVGARVELEGETDEDQIDEAWVYFAGGFGEIRIGSDDEALENSCILPPGGTANFSAFSPNQWGANALGSSPFGVVSNSACTGVDDKGDAQKVIYFSPVFYGFQLSASYTPNPDSETHDDGAGPHTGMPPKTFGGADPDADHDASVYLTYSYQGRNWGLTWGGGASWEFGTDSTASTDYEDQDFYQTALTLDIDRFSIGGVFEYYHDLNSSRSIGFDFSEDLNAWVAGGGIAYAYRAWTFGAQYAYRQDTYRLHVVGFDFKQEQVQQRAVATVNYALGPGINLDGEIGYTWRDWDPDTVLETDDDYDGLEFGIGTALTF
ncbi:porin [Dongia deserti]|uniref:porin n=1 Tax=Dongia deserti TaxID=2268030 RepID=UPI000E6470A4|nr:porin [Dongia deserti]